jgi:uncharacterized membrane protein YhiD involved in acid resistance
MPQEHALMQSLSSQWARTPLSSFVFHLVLAAVLGFVLGRVYVRFGTSLSNRDLFARNFVLLTTTTMLIITIVKSSLALSLGLVGALSIIRFRAAIKEPEELSFLFLAIAVGLGLGADQALITVAAFVVIVAILVVKRLVRRAGQRPNLYLTITTEAPQKIALPQLLATLQRHCSAASLKRFDETPGTAEASFLASFDSVAKVDACTQQLRALSEGVKVSFLDEKGIGA